MGRRRKKTAWYYPTLNHVMWWLVLASVGYLAFLGARYVALETSLFHLENITVVGNDYVPDEAVVVSVGLEEAQSLYAIDIDTVASRVLANNYFRGATVSRQVPSTLRITVEERVPVVYLVDNAIYMVDETGMMLKKLAGMPVGEIPMLTGVTVKQLLNDRTPLLNVVELIEKIKTVDPMLLGFISEIHLDKKMAPEFYLVKGGARVILGDESHFERLYLLSELLRNEVIINRLPELRQIDVTFDGRVVVQKRS